MRRRHEAPDPCYRIREELASREAIIDRYKSEINALIDTHAPSMSVSRLEYIHPGWDQEVPFYCERCHVAWPCPTINDLRRIYGVANGWKPATLPYAPLVLARPKESPDA